MHRLQHIHPNNQQGKPMLDRAVSIVFDPREKLYPFAIVAWIENKRFQSTAAATLDSAIVSRDQYLEWLKEMVIVNGEVQ